MLYFCGTFIKIWPILNEIMRVEVFRVRGLCPGLQFTFMYVCLCVFVCVCLCVCVCVCVCVCIYTCTRGFHMNGSSLDPCVPLLFGHLDKCTIIRFLFLIPCVNMYKCVCMYMCTGRGTEDVSVRTCSCPGNTWLRWGYFNFVLFWQVGGYP